MYRVEEKLGRVFAELAPYPLFPLEEYFCAEAAGIAKPVSRRLVGLEDYGGQY